jgi:thiol-disulfide isomerase/thioredoxin
MVLLKTKKEKIIIFILILILILLPLYKKNKDHSFSINDYKGKWVVINYWAEWCTPCIEEISELNKLNSTYSDYVKVLGVNFDRLEAENLSKAIKKLNINFENLKSDPSDILRISRPSALPTTYIYNTDGELSFKLVGPQTIESILAKIKIEKKTY